ncbi:unnamed protein product, partial [Cylicostephanus goldi]
VRNPHFQFDCRSSKQRPHIARYYRGIIVDIDEDLVDSMYKILYWEDDPHDIDAMSSSQWPAADDTYDCTSSWFGPWDVTASTTHLAKLRTVPGKLSADTAGLIRYHLFQWSTPPKLLHASGEQLMPDVDVIVLDA